MAHLGYVFKPNNQFGPQKSRHPDFSLSFRDRTIPQVSRLAQYQGLVQKYPKYIQVPTIKRGILAQIEEEKVEAAAVRAARTHIIETYGHHGTDLDTGEVMIPGYVALLLEIFRKAEGFFPNLLKRRRARRNFILPKELPINLLHPESFLVFPH